MVSLFTWHNCHWYLHHMIMPLVLGLHDAIWISTSVTGCQWHHKWHHCFPWVKTIEMICNMSLLIMWHHWLQHHIMPTASSMASFHFLCQDNWNHMQYDFLGHVMPLLLVSASHNADGIINETIEFPRPRQPKWSAIWLFVYVMPLEPVSPDSKWHCQ